MQLHARDILYQDWESIPLARLKLILQLLPLVRWELHHDPANTYLKNFILKQLIRTGTEPKTKLKYAQIYRQLTPEQRVDLFTYELGFLQELTEVFLIPAYTIKGKTFQAPMPLLGDISVERLIESDVALYRYIASGKSDYLGHFLACIYTIPGQGFDEGLESNPALLLQIPESEVIAIIRSFLGGKKHLIESNREIFPEAGFDSAQPDKRVTPSNNKRVTPSGVEGRKSKDPAPAWKAFLHELANTKAYPGMHLAKTANAPEALDYFNREQKKIREANQQLQAQRK